MSIYRKKCPKGLLWCLWKYAYFLGASVRDYKGIYFILYHSQKHRQTVTKMAVKGTGYLDLCSYFLS